MYNPLTPLARVRLSEHYTTMYRSLRIEENGIQPIYLDQIRNLTETPTLANRYIVNRFKRLKRSSMIVCFKKLYQVGSTLSVHIAHCFGITIQLALLRVFNVKMKNLEFDTSKNITNAQFSTKN